MSGECMQDAYYFSNSAEEELLKIKFDMWELINFLYNIFEDLNYFFCEVTWHIIFSFDSL